MFEKFRLWYKRRNYSELPEINTFGCFCLGSNPFPHGELCGRTQMGLVMRGLKDKGFKLLGTDIIRLITSYYWINDTTHERLMQVHEFGR